jgi:glycogen synthase
VIQRVLMTADAVGGVWTYSLELARGFVRHGVETSLAVMGPAPTAQQLADTHPIRVLHSACKLEWMDDPWSDVDRAGDWLLQLEKEIQPDVVHLNGYSHGSLPFRAPKVVVGHSCVLSWWEAVHKKPAPREWDEYKRRVTRGLRGADLIVTPSYAMRDALFANYNSRAMVIPNGCTFEQFQPSAKEDFVLTAGRLWDRAKNLQLLEQLAPSLAWLVYAAGDGGGLSNVKTLGVLSSGDMRSWFARAAIYALPARYEPFGLSVLEAALSGCALVLGDIPSLRENWDGAALFASPDRPEKFRDQLCALIESESLREKQQRAALERARNFSSEKMTGAYLAAYGAVRSHFAATCRS